MTRQELREMTNDQLRELCRSRGIHCTTKTTKSALVDLLRPGAPTPPRTAPADIPVASPTGGRVNAVHTTTTTMREPGNSDVVTSRVRVSSGSSFDHFDVIGHNISDVRDLLLHILNIDPEAQAMVNGQVVADDYVIRDNDNVDFIKLTNHNKG